MAVTAAITQKRITIFGSGQSLAILPIYLLLVCDKC